MGQAAPKAAKWKPPENYKRLARWLGKKFASQPVQHIDREDVEQMAMIALWINEGAAKPGPIGSVAYQRVTRELLDTFGTKTSHRYAALLRTFSVEKLDPITEELRASGCLWGAQPDLLLEAKQAIMERMQAPDPSESPGALRQARYRAKMKAQQAA